MDNMAIFKKLNKAFKEIKQIHKTQIKTMNLFEKIIFQNIVDNLTKLLHIYGNKLEKEDRNNV